jgi:hypothetical protein
MPLPRPRRPRRYRGVWFPTNGGAELYFGEGSGTSGAAGLHEATCYGQSSESYDTTQSVGSALNAETPDQSATITLTASGSVPLTGSATGSLHSTSVSGGSERLVNVSGWDHCGD